MAEKPTVKLQFAPGQPAPPTDENGEARKNKAGELLKPSPTLTIAQGEINGRRYSRTFNVAEQPFECGAEEAEMLFGTGHFAVADATVDGGPQTDAAESEPPASAGGSEVKAQEAGETPAVPAKRTRSGKTAGTPPAVDNKGD